MQMAKCKCEVQGVQAQFALVCACHSDACSFRTSAMHLQCEWQKQSVYSEQSNRNSILAGNFFFQYGRHDKGQLNPHKTLFLIGCLTYTSSRLSMCFSRTTATDVCRKIQTRSKSRCVPVFSCLVEILGHDTFRPMWLLLSMPS